MFQIRSLFISALLLASAIIVNAQAPVPDFIASTVAGCGPLSVGFKDLSTNKPLYWTWDFGNGQISSQQNPATVYSSPGTYTVKLIVRNADGANSIVKTDYITVYAFPTAAFSSNLQTACVPANVQFTDASTPGQGSITSWKWDFGDGSGASVPSPGHTFSTTGYYNVSLTVVNSGGCSSTASKYRYIRVVQGVQPDFSWTQTSTSCSAPFDINFINQTAGPGNLSYSWTLGNGNTSTSANPSASYATNNPYTITLQATSDLGCSASTTKTTSFQGGSPVISAPSQACINTPVSFQNASTPAPLSSSWDFGDGSTAAVANPGKAYAATGTYTVTLTNTYAACSATTTKSIQIMASPTASFTADKTTACKAPLTVNFTDQTPGATGWSWDFGDGTQTTSTSATISHTYTTIGTFTVSLIATTATGCTASATQTIQIAAPTVALHGNPTQGCVYPGVIFPTADVTAVDGVATWSWSSPGASTSSNTNTATPSFTYTTQGYYDLSLVITTNGGCTFSQTFKQGVLAGNPTYPTFTVDDANPCASHAVTFSSPSTPVDHWLWLFGDDSSSTAGPSTSHQYQDTGYYTVKLQVYNAGCGQSIVMPNVVHINAPIAGFSYQMQCGNRRQVTFTDTSILDPNKPAPTILWQFGDPAQSTATGSPVTFTYPSGSSTDLYTVTEIVTVPGGCADTTTTLINVADITASFTISGDSVCKYSRITFNSTSTPAGAIASYSWQVNTGGWSAPRLSTIFATNLSGDTGAYTVYLRIADYGGCTYDAPPQTFHVIGPTAKFTTPIGGCRNSPILFTDQSTPYPGYPIRSWSLNGGDNTIPKSFTGLPLTYTYTDTGSYKTTLTVTDTKGCSDQIAASQLVRITTAHAGFFAKDTLFCPNAPLPFTDSSSGSNLTYSWDFGDGSGTAAIQNPTHAYTTDSRYYSVKLKITDDATCADSVTRTNYIHIQSPIAAFSIQDSTSICFPLQTTFIPAGQYYDSLYWDFGDGQTSNLDTTTHFYNNYGTFNAVLHLKGAGGCTAQATHTIQVYNPISASQFTFSPVTGCDTIHAQFNIKPPPDSRFTLLFGDNTADSSGNTTPKHDYDFPNSYVPQLGLQDSTGCIVGILSTSTPQNITVKGAVPFFSMNQKKFCDQGTVFFSDVVINNDPPVSLTWDFGDGQTSTGTVGGPGENPSHAYPTPKEYIVKLTANTFSGCTESYSDSLHVYQTPHPQISTTGLLCTGVIQFQGSLTTPDADTISWTWNFSDGQTSKDQDPLLNFRSGPLTAHLQAAVSFGCNDTISKTINVAALPAINMPATVSVPVNMPVTLPVTYGPDIASYTWSPSTYLDCTNCPNPVSTPVFSTMYTVSITDNDGCSNTDSILVKTICNGANYFLPNTFSPNNDGSNDVFYPRGRGLYNIQSMKIFNRWGQMIFERRNFPANSASEGWDGTINGHPAPSDVYIYIVEVICDNAQVVALKGDVTLLR